MISSIRGQILDIASDAIIVEVGGIGLHVFVPTHTMEELRVGDSVFLYAYLVVREDALTLYGFSTKEEREFFTLLIGVNGVGPRSAINSLSVLTPDAMRRAIYHEQAEVFSRVPGIGMKTAQKILLQLQDRVPAGDELTTAAGFSDVDGEVLNALTALGYSVVEAQAAIQSIPRETPDDVEARLRAALQFFA